jgi:hypothetical protein
MTTATETKTTAPGKGLPGGFPFAALLPGNKDWENTSKQMLQTWKEQLDTSLRLIDAAVQGALEMRSSQLAAAMETHARDLDAEKLVTRAKSASDLLAIQLNWMTGNLERSMAYWNLMFQAASDANTKLLQLLREHSPADSGEREKARTPSP